MFSASNITAPTPRIRTANAAHSDRGSQYTSEAALSGQVQRRPGNVWDSAAMESFFSSLKMERTGRKRTDEA